MPSYWGISSRLMVPVDEGQTEIDKQEYLRKLESTLNEDHMDFEREPGELENRIYETLGDPVMAETILGFLEEPRSVMLDGMD